MLRIKAICKEKGVALQEVASKIGITYQSLYDSINGNPTLNRLKEIAGVLGVEVVELFEPQQENDFTAFVRCGGKSFVFESKEELKEFAQGL